MASKSYKPKLKQFLPPGPTIHYTTSRMRVDLVERLKLFARRNRITASELMNDFIEAGLNMREAAERRRMREQAKREEFEKKVRELNERADDDNRQSNS